MKLATHIVDKPWGQTDLPACYGADPARQVGEIWFEQTDAQQPALPIMIKYLFTSERLSIQVHPDDAQARAAGHAHGKEEVWVVIDAQPGAHVGIGLVRDATTAELRSAALDGSIEQLIDWRPVRRGDVLYNPAGTIHAIGPGLIVAEVQQAIDLTYRLYDYGRPRELHLDAGLAVAKGAPHSDPRDGRLPDAGSAILVTGPHFGLAWCDGDLLLDVPAERPVQILPISGMVWADDAAIAPGACGLATTRAGLRFDSGATALVAWDCRGDSA